MKYLGQYIQQFISRFRNDVFLEDVSSGTIASGGNLGLDSNNKIVKATISSTTDLTSDVTGTLPVGNGGTGATSLTDNKFLLGNGTSAVEASSHFTYYNPDVNQDYIQIGDSSTTLSGIITDNAAPLTIQVDFPIGQTNAAGSDMTFIAGASTGTATAGSFKFRSSPSTGSSGTVLNASSEVAALDNAGNLQLDGNLTSAGIVLDGNTITGVDDSTEFTDDDAHIMTSAAINDRFAQINADTTGNAATATALTSGDKTIEGNLRIGGSGDTSNNWITIDARNGDDASGGGICFYETGTDTIGAPQYGAKIVYNEDDDELAIGTMHNNTFMRQMHMDRGSLGVNFKFLVAQADSSDSADGPYFYFQNLDTSIVDGQNLARILVKDADRDAITSRINWVATEDHDSDSGGTKIDFIVTPNGNSQSETTAMTINQDSSLTVGGAITSGGNTVATTNLALDSFADSTSNAIGVGTIELGHASDTTLARSAAGTVTIEGNTIVTTVGSSTAMGPGTEDMPMTTFQLRKTLPTADMNSLHTTPVVLHNGAGTNKIIMPIGGIIRVDRAATNTNSPGLNIHYSGLTASYGTTSIVHYRRFMNGVTTDAVFGIVPVAAVSNRHLSDLTSDIDNKVVISSDGAFTTDCFTSVDIFMTYQIIQIA